MGERETRTHPSVQALCCRDLVVELMSQRQYREREAVRSATIWLSGNSAHKTLTTTPKLCRSVGRRGRSLVCLARSACPHAKRRHKGTLFGQNRGEGGVSLPQPPRPFLFLTWLCCWGGGEDVWSGLLKHMVGLV